MAWSTQLVCLLTVLITVIIQNEAQIPKYSGSFRAFGKTMMVNSFGPQHIKSAVEMIFEETYHAGKKMSSSYIIVEGQLERLLEINSFNRTYIYTCLQRQPEGKVKQCSPDCQILTPEAWEQVISLGIRGLKTQNGHIVLPLREMLMMNDTNMVVKNQSVTHRNLPARQWTCVFQSTLSDGNIEEITVKAIWSEPDWGTSSGVQKPLAYIIARKPQGKSDGQSSSVEETVFMEVMAFEQDEVDEREFEFLPGFECDVPSSRKFPIESWSEALSYGAEMLLPDIDEILNSEVWIDTAEKVMRIKMDPVAGANTIIENGGVKRSTTKESLDLQIFYNAGLVFKKDNLQDAVCSIETISNFSYSTDPQFLFDVTDADKWSIQSMVGDPTKYTFLGTFHRHDINTAMFQGRRDDWPSTKAHVKSLWEWYFDEQSFGSPEKKLSVLSADVTVKNVLPDKVVGPFYREEQRVSFNFFDVFDQDIYYLHTKVFDVSSCFAANHKERMQFQISFNKSDKDMISSGVTDPEFLYMWKKAIGHVAGFRDNSYRVTQLKAIYKNDTGVEPEVFVLFTLLDRHPDIPSLFAVKEITLDAARRNLTKAVDNKFETTYQGKMLKAVPGTLTETFERPFLFTTPHPLTDEPRTETRTTGRPPTTPHTTRHTSPTTKSSPATQPTGSTRPQSSSTSSSKSTAGSTTVKPTPETRKDKDKGIFHPPGVMAAVAIVMLIVGLAIGAGAIYFKARIYDRSTV